MSRIPTVRVKHPLLGFVTINASDLTPEHELHEEQAEDFEPVAARFLAAPGRLDPALRDAAAALCLRMVAFKRRVADEPFADLSTGEQLAVVQGLEAELTQAEADYEADQRERAACEAEERARQARDQQQDDGGQGDDPERTEQPQSDLPRIAKGPRGLWYVWRGEARVSKGCQTEAEALALLGKQSEG